MEINITWAATVCRVCLHDEQTESNNGASASQMNTIDKKFAKQIYECSGIIIEDNDNLPEKMCNKCTKLLNHAVTFRNTCRKSDEYLKGVIQKAKSAQSLFKVTKKREDLEEEEGLDDIIREDEPELESINIKKKILEKRKNRNEVSPTEPSNPLNNNKKRVKEGTKIVKLEKTLAPVKIEKKDGEVDSLPRKSLRNNTIEYHMSKVKDTTVEQNELTNFAATNSEYSIDEEFAEEAMQQEDFEYEVVEKRSIVGNKDSNAVSGTGRRQENCYYLLNNDTKHEYYDIEGMSADENTIEFIPMEALDSDIKSDQTNGSTDEIEYIVVGAEDEQLQNYAETKGTKLVKNENISKSEIDEKVPPKKKGKFICDVCANHFVSKNLLNYHMRIHRSEKNYECELCSKRFKAACNLSAHMRIHTGEKPFSCQFCGRRFTDRSTHIKHERVHTNERPFECKVCNKTFSLSTTLKAHEKVHTGEKPFKCEPCRKSFKLAHQLKAHLNTYLHKMALHPNS